MLLRSAVFVALLTTFIRALDDTHHHYDYEKDRHLSPIPIINIHSLLEISSRKDKEDVAIEIGKACEEIGFFAITNHGVNEFVVENAWKITTEFFDLSPEYKRVVQSNGEEYPYGYESTENLSVGKAIKEEDICCSKDNEKASYICKHEKSEISPEESLDSSDLKETFSIGPADPTKSGMPGRRFPPKPVGMAESLVSAPCQINYIFFKIIT